MGVRFQFGVCGFSFGFWSWGLGFWALGLPLFRDFGGGNPNPMSPNNPDK